MSIRQLTAWVGCTVICLMTLTAYAGEEKVIHLINGKDLSPFYSYTTNFGVDNDPDHVFTVQDGLVRISGQHMGYLATRETYSNYRLVAEFKWGEKPGSRGSSMPATAASWFIVPARTKFG